LASIQQNINHMPRTENILYLLEGNWK